MFENCFLKEFYFRYFFYIKCLLFREILVIVFLKNGFNFIKSKRLKFSNCFILFIFRIDSI